MREIIRVKNVIERLEQSFPIDAAYEWDNPGLLAGRFDAPVSRIFVTLDVTDDTLAEAAAWNADLILSHHPLIFGSIRSVNDGDLVGRRLVTMLEKGIAYYAMHTNYDVCRMAGLNAGQLCLQETEVLEQTGERNGAPEGIGRVGLLPEEMTLEELAAFVKKQMKLPHVVVYGDRLRKVRRAAVSGGSGKSMTGFALEKQAEVLVTGDIDHHTAIDAVADGLCIIDAGHYGTEYCFIDDIVQLVREAFPECAVKGAEVMHPGTVL